MVMDDIEKDLDMTSGAQGEIVDTIPHPGEPPIGNSPVVQIRDMPPYSLVKLIHFRATPLEGLQDSVIPIELAITTYHIKVQQDKGHTMQKAV